MTAERECVSVGLLLVVSSLKLPVCRVSREHTHTHMHTYTHAHTHTHTHTHTRASPAGALRALSQSSGKATKD